MNAFKTFWVPIFDEVDVIKWAGMTDKMRFENGEAINEIKKIEHSAEINVKLPDGTAIRTSWQHLHIQNSSLTFISASRKSNSIYLPVELDQFTHSPDSRLPSHRKAYLEVSKETSAQLRTEIEQEIRDASSQGILGLEKRIHLIYNTFTAYNDRNLLKCLRLARSLDSKKASDIFVSLVIQIAPTVRTLIADAFRFRKFAVAVDLITHLPPEILNTGIQRDFIEKFSREVEEALELGYESEAIRMTNLAGTAHLSKKVAGQIDTVANKRFTRAKTEFIKCLTQNYFAGAESALKTLESDKVNDLCGIKIWKLRGLVKRFANVENLKDIALCASTISNIANDELREALYSALETSTQRKAWNFVSGEGRKSIVSFIQGFHSEGKQSENNSWLQNIYLSEIERATRKISTGSGLATLRSVSSACFMLEQNGSTNFPYSQLLKFTEALETRNLALAQSLADSLGDRFPANKWVRTEYRKLVSEIRTLLQNSRYRDARRMYMDFRAAFAQQHGYRRRLLQGFLEDRRSTAVYRIKCLLSPVIASLLKWEFPVVYDQPKLSEPDFRLIMAWAGKAHWVKNSIDLGTIADVLDDYESARLFTARSAEVVALDIYSRFCNEVRDVSLGQVKRSGSMEWTIYDIEAGGRCIDIKSARSCLNNESRYSEFAVSSFKNSPQSSSVYRPEDVFVSGFFSKYRTFKSISSGESARFLWIGETSRSQIENVFAFIDETFGDTLNINDFKRIVRDGFFLPGWLFDYPPALYSEYSAAVRDLEESKTVLRYLQRWGNSDLGYVLSIWGDCATSLSIPDQKIARIFVQMKKQCGLSRGAIFLTCLGLCLESARNPKCDLRPSDLRKFLFLNDKRGQLFRPLGVLDPMGFIAELISSLEIVIKNCRKELVKINFFRLAGKGLLQGKSNDGRWTTILAYCGGVNERFGVKCGNSPLVMGLHDGCRLCGKLICNKCGFCDQKCRQCYSSDRVRDLPDSWNDSDIKPIFDPLAEKPLANPGFVDRDVDDIAF